VKKMGREEEPLVYLGDADGSFCHCSTGRRIQKSLKVTQQFNKMATCATWQLHGQTWATANLLVQPHASCCTAPWYDYYAHMIVVCVCLKCVYQMSAMIAVAFTLKTASQVLHATQRLQTNKCLACFEFYY